MGRMKAQLDYDAETFEEYPTTATFYAHGNEVWKHWPPTANRDPEHDKTCAGAASARLRAAMLNEKNRQAQELEAQNHYDYQTD